MRCAGCQSLLAPGQERCIVCGRVAEPRQGLARRASTYRGVHSPTDSRGRPIQAWFDLGPNPWLNLAVGLSILLGFAASAVPSVIVERNRVPASVSDPQLVVERSELFARFLIRDGEGRSLSVGGAVHVTIRVGPPLPSGGDPSDAVGRTWTYELAPRSFRAGSVVYGLPDGSTRRAREVVAQVGPLDVASVVHGRGDGPAAPIIGVALRVEPDRGVPMESRARWFELTEDWRSALKGP